MAITHTQKKSISSPTLLSQPKSPAHTRNSAPDSTTLTAAWKTIRVKPHDTPIKIFKRMGLSLNDLHTILALGKNTQPLRQLEPGEEIRVFITNTHRLLQLIYPISLTEILHVSRTLHGFRAYIEHKHLSKKIEYKTVTIHHSLFSDGDKAGLSDKLITQLTSIFAWDIDFAKDIRKGDMFNVMHYVYFLGNHRICDGKIIASEFTNRNKLYRAVAFTNRHGETHYYTPEGKSLKRRFLRTPVKYTRISSKFQTGRYHPILHLIRAHKGVDYAAPKGTPIHVTSDGKITFIGRKGGYGNTIIVSHGKKYSTLYAHMLRFAHSMKKNKLVHQGDVIGYVGRTGLATGTHLHYEFRINGVHKDPLTVKLPIARPISKQQLKAFKAHTQTIMAQFNAHFR